jgi:hypothetical protein
MEMRSLRKAAGVGIVLAVIFNPVWISLWRGESVWIGLLHVLAALLGGAIGLGVAALGIWLIVGGKRA